jgi:hypothetical protein
VDQEGFQSRRRGWLIVVPIVLVAVVVLGLVVALQLAASDPEFPVLADHPDPGLQGTVAYYSGSGACVRLVAAAGEPSRDVLCLPVQQGKTRGFYGPLLAWLPDGRLQVTAFFQAEDLSFSPGWQKIVDVNTGEVEEVPAAEVPAAPPEITEPAAGPDGRQIAVTSDGGGRVEIVLSDTGGSRTLLSTKGDMDYCIDASPTWSPDGHWIVVEDCHGRILLITVGEPAVTRLLTADTCASVGLGRTCLAVTGVDLFAAAG